MPYYLTPEQDDYNHIPELQVCLAEALTTSESVLAEPSVFNYCSAKGPGWGLPELKGNLANECRSNEIVIAD
jgi:hypothetical protein